jgi:adenylate cyclase
MFSSCIGLGVAEFEIGSFDRAAYWWTRLLAEHPSAVWGHRFIAPAYLLAGKKDQARRSFAQLVEAYPDLTIRDVRSALPHTDKYMDRACEGLKTLGLRL